MDESFKAQNITNKPEQKLHSEITEETIQQHLNQPSTTNLLAEQTGDKSLPNMEVHKHPHHVTHKKKWSEYLLEFFMLFLAVFLGFIAEDLREHRVEKERAKQYVHSFYNDLRNDTAEYSNLITEYDFKLKGLAGRKDCYESLSQAGSNGCLQNLIELSRGFTDLITSDQTLQQLKNSGSFRLLSQQDADSLLLYDKMVRTFIKRETTGFQENIYNLRNTMYSLLNYEEVSKSNGDGGKPILVSDNKQLLNRFFNLLDDNVWRRQSNLKALLLLKQKATSVIIYFQNKYDLQ
ncbi:MAG: hypothetical protein JWN76_3272 [Chitinophagaceae bacterium]|nr:hypothetical protein [Chitinophagaceae bacterium]